MRSIPQDPHPDLLVGYESSDDAGVFRVGEELALVQTVDFITPIVDDPRSFGRIAAANSLSDVYAMGGRPLTAMNILCFPSDMIPVEFAAEILRGGLDKIEEAGAVLVGGHSIKDQELKFGLSVTGLVEPERILKNSGARPGDMIIITKPVGSGIVSTAVKAGVAGREEAGQMVREAETLNRRAAEIMAGFDVHACTDVTGFGLGGHLLEVARASGVEIELHVEDIPLLSGAKDYAMQGLIPGGSHNNRKFCASFVKAKKGMPVVYSDLVFDPQTSGGLLIFMGKSQAGECLRELHGCGVEGARIIGQVIRKSHCGGLKLC